MSFPRRDIQKHVPFAIIRPSGVVSAASEPLPGWVDAYLLVEPLIDPWQKWPTNRHVRSTNIGLLSILMIIINQRTSMGAEICMSCVGFILLQSLSIKLGFTWFYTWWALRGCSWNCLLHKNRAPTLRTTRAGRHVNLCNWSFWKSDV